MASEHVLRIPRAYSPGDYVLLNTSPNGSSPLDLRLLATEGTEPYVKTLKHSRISKYRAKSNHLSDPQWEDLLRSTLLQERITKPNDVEQKDVGDEDPSKDLELVSSLSHSKITITFRKSISGIHQKLGELSLPADPEADINLFDWASTAVARAERLQTETLDLQRQLAGQTQTVQKLNEQLEDLIQAKKEHEDALVLKCCLLLNEKKAKIRDQQRLLHTAKPRTEQVKETLSPRQQRSARKRSPKASRSGKRKASAPPAAASRDEEDGAFEDKDVKIEEEEEEPDSEQVTPQHSDLDETEDEVDASDLESVPAPQTAKGKVMEGVEGNERPGEHQDEDVEIPPRRELPFRKGDEDRKVAKGEDKEQDTNMADGDETDDDEL
ncbi:MAG: hypothetical protein LQ338_005627 [Usnochroma carphineum]|nr:MAG: hypothetical protein LQ338_005627 [Usnochroma carphineum]